MELVDNQNWEAGSEFALAGTPGRRSTAGISPWSQDGRLFGSGRDALVGLLKHGMKARGWRRLWMPGYFCPEVVLACRNAGIEVKRYRSFPVVRTNDEARESEFRMLDGDVLFVQNFFGLQNFRAERAESRGREVIEDHSHDPWSPQAIESRGDWCVASLRKTLPIPDGGVLWSPRGHRLPPQPKVAARLRRASLEKLAAMLLKGWYLEGRPVSKATFRGLSASGESCIGTGPLSGMTPWSAEMVDCLPVSAWRSLRARNHGILSAALKEVNGVRVLSPEKGARAVPFGAFLVFESPQLRDRVRRALIDRRIYPAIHWSLSEFAEGASSVEAQELSRRVLTVHCDFRHRRKDMLRIAEEIKRGCTRHES